MDFIRRIAALVSLLALAAPAAHAQLFRAYLSLDGLDTNPCTLPAPCRLLPAALNAIHDGGEIWMLDSANYNTGPVTVGKSVTILAVPGVLGSVVALDGDALVISTTGAVTLRNLNILPFPGNANRTGVNKNGAGTLTIQDCNIFGFSNVGMGVLLQGPANVTVTRTVFRDNSVGVEAMNGPVVGISDSVFSNHGSHAISGQAYVNPTSVRISVTRSVARNTGISAFTVYANASNATASLHVADSRIEGSGGAATGVSVTGDTPGVAVGSVSGSVLTGLAVGAGLYGGANARLFLTGNTIVENTTGVEHFGGTAESAGDNALRNNGVNVSVGGTLTNVGRQ